MIGGVAKEQVCGKFSLRTAPKRSQPQTGRLANGVEAGDLDGGSSCR
jgi:hypothetical protein